MWDGYLWRQEQEENRIAYFVCSLMNVEGKSLKRPMTPKQLLEPIRKPKVKRDKKQDEEYLKELFKNTLQGGG
jgi:hypothetical protein